MSETSQLIARLQQETEARREAERLQAESSKALSVLQAQVHEAIRAKSDFLRNMGHELRTPLNAIVGFTALLASSLQGKIPESDFENLLIASTSAHELLRIINQTLEMTRLQSDDYTFEPDRVSVKEVLLSCLDIRQQQIAAAAIVPMVEVAPDLPEVVADRSALTKCMLVFLDNAIKYSNGAKEIMLAADNAEEGVVIMVADRGIGIPEDYVDRVTEPFVQVDNRLAKTSGGAGLGLSIARVLLEKQGGRLRIISHLGHGTTIQVHLPRA